PFVRYVDAHLNAHELSYKELIYQALRISSLLDRFGVSLGAKVVLVLSNPLDIFLLEVGALLTGRVPIVFAHPSPKLTMDDFARTLLPVIDNAEPALIVADIEHSKFLSSAIGRRVACFEHVDSSEELPRLVENPTPPLFIQYSSGTTGTKKGVNISQEQLLWQIDTYASEIKLDPNDHIISWLPFYHDMGLITALMMPLLTGVKVTLMSPFHWVKNPLSLLEVISRDKGTLCWLPNFAYNFLAQTAKHKTDIDLKLRTLRGVINCSEPVSDTSHKLFVDTFSRYGLEKSSLAASYAMAETTFAVTSGGFDHPVKTTLVDRSSLKYGQRVLKGEDTLTSSGRLLPGTQVRILGPDGIDLEDGHIGEIAVSSPSVMGGYFKNASATVESQSDGYFKTGDLGYRDENDLYITGRIKDLIITAGRNIYPQDLESVANDISGVIPGRCVAFGITDESKGTETIVIVAESNATNEEERRKIALDVSLEITARFDVALADVLIAKPQWLKKSTSGKIARGQNRDRYLKERDNKSNLVPSGADPQTSRIRQCIHDVTGRWINDESAPLLTSGLIDSLALTNLILSLEESFGVKLPPIDETEFEAFDTITSIKEFVTSGQKPKENLVPKLVVDRRTKANYVLEGKRNFDSAIFGSSRSYMVRAKHAAKYDLQAFQFTVGGVRAEEYFCMLNFLADTIPNRLKHIIVGIDPTQFAPHLPIDIRFLQTRQLVRYMKLNEAKDQHGLEPYEELESLETEEEKAKYIQLRYRALDNNAIFNRNSGDIDRLWGHHVDEMPLLEYSYENKSKLPGVFMLAQKSGEFHPGRLHYFKKFINLSQDLGCKLTMFTNPVNSKLAQDLESETPYWTAQNRLLDMIDTEFKGNISLFPFKTPTDFNGDDRDYFDGSHMGRHNGDKILDFILQKV
ncbi:MAG: non-ribosomal peptide synthetase, partial [Rhodospirillaceae bacterium]